jgi:uncharacterized protein
MELLWTAFLLGLVGSLHCAVMCGPLVLAVSKAVGAAHSRLVYHAGRLTTYGIIGVLFGAVGKTFALAGLQRWLSILAGVAILAGLFLSGRVALKTPMARAVVSLKSTFGTLLQRRGWPAQFTLGALNGLLPCGLVYVAAAGAAITVSPWAGAGYMIAFGLGTLPMMFGLGVVLSRLRLASRWQKLIPVSICLMAALLLLRGMELGIPYISPRLTGTSQDCH